MNWDMLKPNYAIEIKTEAQARLYRKVLLAKIAVQVLVILGLLALGGASWQTLAIVVGVATVWQASTIFNRKRKQKQNQQQTS